MTCTTLKKLSFQLMAALTVVAISVPVHAQGIPGNPSRGPQIWFNPLTWSISPTSHALTYSQHDLPALIHSDAEWRMAAARVSVLMMPHNVVWSYPDRGALVKFFAAHKFKTAFQFGMLFDDDACPKGIEGVSQDHNMNRESVQVAKQWHDAGGHLDFVVMDGPLAFGHYLAKNCIHSISDTVRRTVATLRGIRTYFPNVQVVDAEGPGILSDVEWLSMMGVWLDEFEKQSGQPITAVALDLHWKDLRPQGSWQQTTERAVSFLHRRQTQTGLFINDDQTGADVTDTAWMQNNRRHINVVANNSGFGLDFILIGSWMHHPRNNLPETDSNAYTSLIDYAYTAFAKGH